MIKIVLFILFPICVFSQQMDYESLSDQQLEEVFQKELRDMEARGAPPDLIMKKFVVDLDMYLVSRETYFRFLVHTDYMLDKFLSTKMQDGTDKPSDFEMAEKFKNLKKQKSYKDYVDHKKTDEAKEQWENSTQDGILKLVVDNHEQYTEAEQKRYDGLIILLNRDPYFTSLKITDGQTIKLILPNAN